MQSGPRIFEGIDRPFLGQAPLPLSRSLLASYECALVCTSLLGGLPACLPGLRLPSSAQVSCRCIIAFSVGLLLIFASVQCHIKCSFLAFHSCTSFRSGGRSNRTLTNHSFMDSLRRYDPIDKTDGTDGCCCWWATENREYEGCCGSRSPHTHAYYNRADRETSLGQRRVLKVLLFSDVGFRWHFGNCFGIVAVDWNDVRKTFRENESII